ncbi:SMI1/KNR4 family protein [Streptomyces sp. NPDC089919]|uniref:SMI1/KNR4 family protein n=1 Tax=Streptomyces sp. NPDC089919 TaxID=3155188 RepID=UPI0034213BE8
MTQTTPFDWRPFLLRWSAEWADARPADETLSEEEEAARRERWLGFPPAAEERIAALEERLGRRLPPSYRQFLEVSDGWRHAGGFVWLLAGTADAHWHDNASGLADLFEEYLDEDSGPEARQSADLWRRGLQLDVESDATHVLLDPEEVDADGEWAVYTWASWRGEGPERHADFRAFMLSMFQEFHSMRADPEDGWPEFANDTTRELDELVARGRRQALDGAWEAGLAAFDEAREYGRPRATGLGDQVRRLLGQTYMVEFDGVACDPRYAPELLPPLVAEHAAHSYRDDSVLRSAIRGAGEDVVALAHELLRQVRAGDYRYTAAGGFGEAVSRARELVRWGDGDRAWAALVEALPLWEPLGPDHLVPLGWLADPLLGPLLTPERGRELLAMPRAGRTGGTAGPRATCVLDPEGLAWLADPDPGGVLTSYRFVLVEDVAPQELPGRLGAAPSAGLGAPRTTYEARRRTLGSSTYDDRALLAVGRAGSGWSFAFDAEPAPFDARRFVSPAVAASAGTRAVVVWSGLRSQSEQPFFHLSVARDGAEEYAFTYAAGALRRSGDIPEALDPDRCFGPGAAEEVVTAGERALLEAVAREFEVRLPRHALLHGRLHTVTSGSWTRPPADGETYTVITLEGGWMQ